MKEEEMYRELADATLLVQKQQLELKEIKLRRTASLHEQEKKTSGRISLEEVQVYSRYLWHLRKKTMSGEGILTVLTRDQSIKRQKLLEAARERQKLEKLQRKRETDFVNENNRAQTRETDNLATANFRRITKERKESS
jgi:flagellar export protein FliJ